LALAAGGYLLALPQLQIANVTFDIHTLLVSSLLGIVGWQAILLAVFAKLFAAREKMMPPNPSLENLSVEKLIGLGTIFVMVGAAMISGIALNWWSSNFGRLNYPETMRWVIPGVTLAAIGFQTMMAALMVGALKMHPQRANRPIHTDTN
jgi:hypothetical protein